MIERALHWFLAGVNVFFLPKIMILRIGSNVFHLETA